MAKNPLVRGVDCYADAEVLRDIALFEAGEALLTVSGANSMHGVAPLKGRIAAIFGQITTATTDTVSVLTLTTTKGVLVQTVTVPVGIAGVAFHAVINEEVNNVLKEGDLITVTSDAGATAGVASVGIRMTPFQDVV